MKFDIRRLTAAMMKCLRLYHVLGHHLAVAVVVASVIGLLHHGGALEWLDSIMLRVAGSFAAKRLPDRPADVRAPLTLLISGAMYEQSFGGRSPLDRKKMAELVRTIRENPGGPPATAVFDLDLSAVSGDSSAQEALDAELQRLSQFGALIVLAVPSPAFTSAVAEAKAHWVKKVCSWRQPGAGASGGVIFASPELRVNAGLVQQYSANDLSLGIAATRPHRFDDLCARSDSELLLITQFGSSSQVAPLTAGDHGILQTRPFNADYFLGLDWYVHAYDSLDRLPSDASGQPLSLAGRTIFIGGAYDPRDRFTTDLEADGQPTEGVTLHAAVYYSAMTPVTIEQGFGAFAIDVVLGVLAGYLFTAAWAWHSAAQHMNGWRGYLMVTGSLIGILVITVVLALLLVWLAAGVLYPLNFWVSPGPVILGVCAKVMLSRGAHGSGHASPHASRWVNRSFFALLVLAYTIGALHHG